MNPALTTLTILVVGAAVGVGAAHSGSRVTLKACQAAKFSPMTPFKPRAHEMDI